MSYSAYLIRGYDVNEAKVDVTLKLLRELRIYNTPRKAYSKVHLHIKSEIYDQNKLKDSDHVYVILDKQFSFNAYLSELTKGVHSEILKSIELDKQIFLVYPNSREDISFYSVNFKKNFKFISGIQGTSFNDAIAQSFFNKSKSTKDKTEIKNKDFSSKKYRRLLLLPIR